VWSAYQQGGLREIRAYCETDVVNTFLVYTRFQRMRGVLTDDAFVAEEALARATLKAADGEHWREFLAAWPER
jgi:predicted PolB exonuclease-like 3'-5' exonuclease